jgi:hypothetical protein
MAQTGMWFINNGYGAPGFLPFLLPIVLVFLFWSVFWKGLGLWHAGRRGDVWWFIILLLINTLGILEIIYLFFVAKLKVKELLSRHEHHTHSHS